MPRAAIATGMVDLVLAPGRSRASSSRSRASVRAPCRPQQAGGARRRRRQRLDLRDEHLQRVFTLLRASSGVDFRQLQAARPSGGVCSGGWRCTSSRTSSSTSAPAEDPGRSAGALPGPADPRDALLPRARVVRGARRSTIFPSIVESQARRRSDPRLGPRLLHGEEAYSVAIRCSNISATASTPCPIQIFATDVSESAIEHARTGLSREHRGRRLARTPAAVLHEVDGSYRVNKTVRDLCVFARQDLTRDPPFSKLDLIVCRNVLIYMSLELQQS